MKMFKKMIVAMVLLGSVFAGNAMAGSKTVPISNVKKIRTHGKGHPVTAVQKTTAVWIDGLDCLIVWFYSDDDAILYSNIMLSLDKATTVDVEYNEAETSPWGDVTACRLMSYTVNR